MHLNPRVDLWEGSPLEETTYLWPEAPCRYPHLAPQPALLSQMLPRPQVSFPPVPHPVLPTKGSCPTWGQWLLWGRQVLEYSANLFRLREVSAETAMFSFSFLPSSFAYQSPSRTISGMQTGTGFLYLWLCCTPNFKLSCKAVIKMAPSCCWRKSFVTVSGKLQPESAENITTTVWTWGNAAAPSLGCYLWSLVIL